MIYVLSDYEEILGIFTNKPDIAKFWENTKIDCTVEAYKPNQNYQDVEPESYSSACEIYEREKRKKRLNK